MADGMRSSGAGFSVSEAGSTPPFQTLDLEALLGMAFPPREMLLAPWLPEKGLAMVYGPRGIGKTHFSLGVAYAVATGGAFLSWRAPRPRRVLVIDGEMPAVVLQERLAAIVAASSLEPPAPDYLRVLPMDMQEGGNLDLSNEACHPLLEAEMNGVELVIVDNISTLARGGRENEAESWLPVQEWSLTQRRAGRSVVFIHHAGKGGQQRGTSRREDVLDTIVSLQRPADYQPDEGARFEVRFEKSRGFHGDDAKPFEASLTLAHGWTTRDLADAEMAQVMALTGDGMTVRDIADVLNMSKSKVSRLQTKGREAAAAAASTP